MGHLEDKYGGFYGNIGDSTIFIDDDGEPLNIGDTIMLYDNSDNRLRGEYSVVKTDVFGRMKEFIMSIEVSCNDKTGEISDGWRVVKHRSYDEITEDKVDDIFYIRSEEN